MAREILGFEKLLQVAYAYSLSYNMLEAFVFFAPVTWVIQNSASPTYAS